MDENELYPLYNSKDMEKFIHEIPNLFVFSGDYPHFTITTQDGITNIIEKQQDFILENVDNSKYITIPLTEFLDNIEHDNEADLNPVSFVKTLVLENSHIIANELFLQNLDNQNEWKAVKNPNIEDSFKYIAAVSNQINALCGLLDLIKNNEDLTAFIEKHLNLMMNNK